jgi:hypothetical protein
MGSVQQRLALTLAIFGLVLVTFSLAQNGSCLSALLS